MPSSWSAVPPSTGSPGSRERDLRVRPALIGPSSAWLSREVQEMAEAWARGDCVSAEELLARRPELGDEAAVRLIYEEVCLRRERGDEVATTEVVNRFPRWKEELEVVLGCDRVLRPVSRVASFPAAGEDLGPFRILEELGQGASGKTYLAAEPALLDRLVVLKVISDDQEEHLSLARLQHTHIIPLFSEHRFAERGLRALCMPYLGGASLARILDGVFEIPPARRRGRHIIEILDRMQAGKSAAGITDGPYRRYLDQADYVQAVCWIAAGLADALHSAHVHGLIHMDVKPSNVLIADDGLPILLDFHLAHRPIDRGELIADRLGGTPGWMAPEHRAAFEAASSGHAVPEPVDPRADVYALALLVREALVGPGPVQDKENGRHWRLRNPLVSAGLADIVDKCLAKRPSDRYGDAALLADDLRRQMSDLPLRGVPNRSIAERWRKWRRRRPAALTRWTARITALSALAVMLMMGQALHRQRVAEIDTALQDGQKLRSDGRYPQAVQILGRGLARASGVPGVTQLRRSLREQVSLARQEQKAAALHDLADLVRFRYGIDLPAPEEARMLLKNIRDIWKERSLLFPTNALTRNPAIEQAIRTDLLDLTVTWIELLPALAPPPQADAARENALQLVDDAQASCGPSARLDRLHDLLTGAPGQPDSRRELGSVRLTVLDHYDLGRSYLRAARFREAAREFQIVLDERPRDFWSNFYQGSCAYRMEQFQDALGAFRTCIALAPDSAVCYYNRARAAEALGRFDQAFGDYSRALERDPDFSPAFLNRGSLAYSNGRHDDAVADFLRALRGELDSRTIGLIQYNLALAFHARGDSARAIASAREALAHGNDAASSLSDRLRREH